MSEREVLAKLLEDHVGRHNAITQSQLADALGMNPSTLRSELGRLRDERNIPIGNLRDGYYVISDREELKEFIAHINSEIESKKSTIENTLKAYDEFDEEIETPETVIEQTYHCSKCGTDVPKSKAKWPKDGQYKGEVLCSYHFGELVMQGEV